MKVKFEYTSALIQYGDNPVKGLDDLGQKGWEAYAAVIYDDNAIVHFLKRRLIVEEDLSPARTNLPASEWRKGAV